jgi:hypothetical protein
VLSRASPGKDEHVLTARRRAGSLVRTFHGRNAVGEPLLPQEAEETVDRVTSGIDRI